MRSTIKVSTLKRSKKETSFKIETESDLFSESIDGFIILTVYTNVIGNKNAFAVIHTSEVAGQSSFAETASVKNGWEGMIRESLLRADDLGALGVNVSVSWGYPDWFKDLLVGCGFKKSAWPYYYAELSSPKEKGK